MVTLLDLPIEIHQTIIMGVDNDIPSPYVYYIWPLVCKHMMVTSCRFGDNACKEGKWRSFRGGNVIVTCDFVNGIQHGKCIAKHENDELWKLMYHHGRLVSTNDMMLEAKPKTPFINMKNIAGRSIAYRCHVDIQYKQLYYSGCIINGQTRFSVTELGLKVSVHHGKSWGSGAWLHFICPESVNNMIYNVAREKGLSTEDISILEYLCVLLNKCTKIKTLDTHVITNNYPNIMMVDHAVEYAKSYSDECIIEQKEDPERYNLDLYIYTKIMSRSVIIKEIETLLARFDKSYVDELPYKKFLAKFESDVTITGLF